MLSTTARLHLPLLKICVRTCSGDQSRQHSDRGIPSNAYQRRHGAVCGCQGKWQHSLHIMRMHVYFNHAHTFTYMQTHTCGILDAGATILASWHYLGVSDLAKQQCARTYTHTACMHLISPHATPSIGSADMREGTPPLAVSQSLIPGPPTRASECSQVDDPYGNALHESWGVAKGEYAFTALHAGEHRACFTVGFSGSLPVVFTFRGCTSDCVIPSKQCGTQERVCMRP